MKNILLIILLLPFLAYTQTDKNISVISSERTHILYRGIMNPLKIAVPGSKSFKVTAPGLTEIDSLGNCRINITGISGKEVIIKIEAIMQDNRILKESKTFEVRDIIGPIGLINGQNCYNCIVQLTKNELMDARVGIKYENMVFNNSNDFLEVKSFSVSFPRINEYIVGGNRMNKKEKKIISKLKNGDVIKIIVLGYGKYASNYKLKNTHPITIQIIEEED